MGILVDGLGRDNYGDWKGNRLELSFSQGKLWDTNGDRSFQELWSLWQRDSFPSLTFWNLVVSLVGCQLHLVSLQGILERRIVRRDSDCVAVALLVQSNCRVVSVVANNRCCRGRKYLHLFLVSLNRPQAIRRKERWPKKNKRTIEISGLLKFVNTIFGKSSILYGHN